MLEINLSLKAGGAPLYEQIYQHLAAQIREGKLPAETKMPGRRSLAGALGVSVHTVDTAYQMLTAEGYLESQPRSGYYVQESTELLPGEKNHSPVLPAQPAAPEAPERQWNYDLSTSSVDVSLFPFRTWGRIQKELLYSSPELLQPGHRQGEVDLRRVLADYLAAYRGVRCQPDQIVIGAGTEYLAGLLPRLVSGSIAAVENPGYRRTRVILENNGMPCRLVSIDKGGLSVAELERTDANFCYVTPSHQFPTGVTMPVARRRELLRWAAQAPGRYILEDDYDSEFRFDIRPLPSLQGMAGPEGPVIYLTTFSKSLAPGIRIACMVLPRNLIQRYRSLYGGYANTVGRFEQQTLCRFIEEGHFARHLARMRKTYRSRMEQLSASMKKAFLPQPITIQGQHTGLHLLLTLPEGAGDRVMAEQAMEVGAKLAPLSEYYMTAQESCPANTVVLGYAALAPDGIEELAEALKHAWCKGE